MEEEEEETLMSPCNRLRVGESRCGGVAVWGSRDGGRCGGAQLARAIRYVYFKSTTLFFS